MNIFYFDDSPIECALAQPDKMLVKMPLETAQMLCTAHRELDGDEYADEVGLYKRAYWNHPCTVWARETKLNYLWLYTHFLALGSEYKFRYGREHASITKLAKPLQKVPDNILLIPFFRCSSSSHISIGVLILPHLIPQACFM